MSGIAQLFLDCGKRISGSDIKESAITLALQKNGARIFIGHNAEHVRNADAVVYSSAITQANPELVEAKRLGIPVLKRAQALAELMQEKTVITVAGSHGKTTTASLAACLLLDAGLSPTAAIGGILRNLDNNACMGKGRFFVAEADESDGSFLYYRPHYSIITNIDREHLDYYHSFAQEQVAFKDFLYSTQPGGCAFCCDDDAYLKPMLQGFAHKYVLFGMRNTAHVYPEDIELGAFSSRFDCVYFGTNLGRFELAVGGAHNISNALAVIALGCELGIHQENIKKTLAYFKGAKRRMEIKFDQGGILVLDDYAHHPTEIMATLGALQHAGRKRVIAIFQPHRYSRTQCLLEEFAGSFDLADILVVTDIYPASEQPIDGVNAALLCRKVQERSPQKEIVYLQKKEIVPFVVTHVRQGDAVITLGAGDIIQICDELVGNLRGQH